MQLVDFFIFVPYIVGIMLIVFISMIFVLKMRLDISAMKATVNYYNTKTLNLLVQNTILYRLSMALTRRLFTKEQIENIKNELASDFVNTYKVELGGKRPDELTLQWVNGLINGIDAYFLELADLAPDSDLLVKEEIEKEGGKEPEET